MRTDPKVDTKSLELMENVLAEAAQKVYEMHERKFSPLFPWVFVRVLQKEQIQNGIILPAIEQNKTIHEGIVLAKWRPFERAGKHYQCSVETGQHVLFPHFAGLPVQGYSDKHYRVIRSEAWVENEQGGIFATVDYDDRRLEDVLFEMLAVADATAPVSCLTAMVENITRRFLLVDRNGTSVTLSGR